MVYLKYNGNRFPRAVILNKHRKEVFHPTKRVIEFENSDAYLILKYNSRLNPRLWEFDIVDEIACQAKAVKVEVEAPVEAPKQEPKLEPKATEPKAKKAMEPMRTLKPKQSKRGR